MEPVTDASELAEALPERVRRWISDDPEPATRAELTDLLERWPATAEELADRFAGRLVFGTAGLRGPVRAGPNGMNRAVVRAAAAGLVSYLDSHGVPGPVVIGYDARHGSTAFATETARVVTGAGRQALVLPRPLPTPVLAFATRALGAAAGVMVTASHNPPADNGYKVYLGDGAQIVPPVDREIEAAISAVGPLAAVALGGAGERLDESVITSYVDSVVGLAPVGARTLTIAYTPLHGVGCEIATRVLSEAGFAAVHTVPAQSEPDPDFPTVAFPNPEEPGAMDALLALAAETDADLAIANDPDADRCAVAIPSPDGWRVLRGDELGVLLADHMMSRGARGTYATTIVSSSMLRAMCTARGLSYVETLTGFKWLARSADDLAFAYEEALGYAVAPELVRDKDGISAALLVAEFAAATGAQGYALGDRLDALYREFGLHLTDQISVRLDDVADIDAVVRRLRAALPHTLLDAPVTKARDLAPDADVVVLRAEGIRVVVRPSGTEPKLKVYLEIVVPGVDLAAARTLATTRLRALRADVTALLELDGF